MSFLIPRFKNIVRKMCSPVTIEATLWRQRLRSEAVSWFFGPITALHDTRVWLRASSWGSGFQDVTLSWTCCNVCLMGPYCWKATHTDLYCQLLPWVSFWGWLCVCKYVCVSSGNTAKTFTTKYVFMENLPAITQLFHQLLQTHVQPQQEPLQLCCVWVSVHVRACVCVH